MLARIKRIREAANLKITHNTLDLSQLAKLCGLKSVNSADHGDLKS
jgi:hypothetical protein